MAEHDDEGNFFKKYRELLVIERDEEAKMNAELFKNRKSSTLKRRGVRLTSLMIDSVSTGVTGGNLMVTFCARQGLSQLPSHRMTVGDTVRVTADQEEQQDEGCEGVVCKVAKTVIVCMLAKGVDHIAKVPHRLDLVLDSRTWDRLFKVSSRLLSANSLQPHQRTLYDVLMGRTPPLASGTSSSSTLPASLAPGVKHLLATLNPSQREAVENATSASRLAVIHGPPGTGKTTTVAAVVAVEVAKGHRVLCCAPSNLAVDTLLQKVVASCPTHDIRPLRLGHPARLLPEVLPHCLDQAIVNSEASGLCSDIKCEMAGLYKNLAKPKQPRATYAEARAELKLLRKELRTRERSAVTQCVKQANVIFSTCTGAACRELRDLEDPFDVVIVDEAAQALEIACWLPALLGRRLVLAGDHLQLPPTLTSDKAAHRGLQVTLLDRQVALWPRAVRMLSTQYRMHASIAHYSNVTLYEGKVESDPSVADNVLADIVPSCAVGPLCFIDTSGCNMAESKESEGSSTQNDGEALLVVQHVELLLDEGLEPRQIGIITPYNAQVQAIRGLFEERGTARNQLSQIEVSSVDGFQGREKEAIIISFVRSNAKGNIGFLKEFRRTNVAITRAKRHLCLIGDARTLRSDKRFLAGMCKYMEEHAEYRSLLSETQLAKAETEVVVAAVAEPKEQRGKSVIRPTQNVVKESPFLSDIRKRLIKVKEEQSTVRFDPTLKSSQRKMVHKEAADLDLYHWSEGNGTERFVVVSAKPKPSEAELASARVDQPATQEEEEESQPVRELKLKIRMLGPAKEQRLTMGDNVCVGDVMAAIGDTKHEYELVLLGRKQQKLEPSVVLRDVAGSLSRLAFLQTKPPGKKTGPPAQRKDFLPAAKKPAPKKAAKGKKSGYKKANKKNEVLLPHSPLKVNPKKGECNFVGCDRAARADLSSWLTCVICSRQFCTGHSLPETHGCGRSAQWKVNAVKQKDASSTRERAKMQRALETKLKEKAAQRTKKTQAKNKKH